MLHPTLRFRIFHFEQLLIPALLYNNKKKITVFQIVEWICLYTAYFLDIKKKIPISISINWWPRHRRDLHACLDREFPLRHAPWWCHTKREASYASVTSGAALVLPKRTFILGTWSCTLPRGYILHIFLQPIKEESQRQTFIPHAEPIDENQNLNHLCKVILARMVA